MIAKAKYIGTDRVQLVNTTSDELKVDWGKHGGSELSVRKFLFLYMFRFCTQLNWRYVTWLVRTYNAVA